MKHHVPLHDVRLAELDVSLSYPSAILSVPNPFADPILGILKEDNYLPSTVPIGAHGSLSIVLFLFVFFLAT